MPDITVAASEKTLQEIFAKLRDTFVFDKSGSQDFGPFTASYHAHFHLEGGELTLEADNTVLHKELDLKWDTLNLTLAVDIPELCVGGFCIIPTPFGCLLEAPKICVFSDDPDITVTLPLGGFTSEMSLKGSFVAKYFIDPARPADMNDWDAQDAIPPLYNRWRVFLDPTWVDIDPIDVADTVADLLERIVDAAIDNLLGFLPDWAKDIIKTILGATIDLIRKLLDIPDDIQEWVSNLFNVSFGLLDIIAQFFIDQFAAKTPLHEIEDPYPLLAKALNPNSPSHPMLVPVKVPLRNIAVFNTEEEMVLQLDVG